jgi:surface antigen
VRNLTVALRSLILTATIISLGACSTTTPYQTSAVQVPAVNSPTGGTSIMVDVVNGLYITNKYGLDKQQKQKQTAAFYTALDSDYGKVISWYERNAMGHVKAVHGYPQGRGFCRVVYSQVTVKGRSRHFEETVCKKHLDDVRWHFVRK